MSNSRPIAATRTASKRIRVLFDSPAAWPILCPRADGGIGGAELRAVTFARQLAERPEFDIHLLVSSARNSTAQIRDQVTIHFDACDANPAARRSGPWAGLRRGTDRLAGSVLKRLAGIPERRRSIEHLDHDVLCCFGVNNRTASLVRSAHHTGRRAIVFLTSDRSLSDIQLRGRRQRGVYGELGCLCRFALNTADAVIVQTRLQQAELQQRLGIHARLLRNPIDLRTHDEPPTEMNLPAEPYVLWVGRADTFSKRADRCWRVARECPDISFVAIMNEHEPATFQQLRATQPANVRLIPCVPIDQIEHYYRRATLLMNTSDAEGFPNSFLQAGKYGVPIVSLNVDPDGMLSDQGGGFFCRGSMETMKLQLNRLIGRGSEYERMARRVKQYTRQFHELQQRADALAELIREVMDRRAAA
jgi:glycosyltransferase involved in cell wall biosynthesis